MGYNGYGPGYPNVMPFVHRDGETAVMQVNRLANTVNAMVEHVNAAIVDAAKLNDEKLAEIDNKLAENLENVALDVAAYKNEIAAQISALEQSVAIATENIINSSIEVTDPVIEGVLKNPLSKTRVMLDALYGA